jgi:hypothetical protein
LNHGVKLHSISRKSQQKWAFVVEHARLIVNGPQIWVDEYFLDFQIIAIGKIGDNGINVFLIRFRKRYFSSGVFDVTNGISGMNPRNVIAIHYITVMNSCKRSG